ncbi:MAG TPA: serine hydrolase [Chthoniobacteraceae bacterium]|nr:serine hydrolase [Chthoniobacteraceae bacterium]
MPAPRLLQRIQEISARAGCDAVAVSVYDYESTVRFAFQAGRHFHAASTIKVALLLALLKAVDEGKVRLGSRLHVRNRFRSVVGDAIFKVSVDRDGDRALHKRIGRAVPIAELARAMIVRSSNLATNLLFDFLGRDYIRAVIAEACPGGVDFQRGVEDDAAFDQGVNNEVTADGLLALFRLFLEPGCLTERRREAAIEILLAQEFNGMIPAKLPADVRVAHKTGEISTACHDAGIVFLPERKPYVVAILSSVSAEDRVRHKVVAEISHLVFQYLTAPAKRHE